MNWLGLSIRSLLGIVLGAALGSLLYVFSYPSVLVVGACTGFGCALLAEDRSLLRGISVLTVAAWTGAALDAHRFHIPTLRISSILTGGRLALHLASLATAFLLGALSLQNKHTRVAGT